MGLLERVREAISGYHGISGSVPMIKAQQDPSKTTPPGVTEGPAVQKTREDIDRVRLEAIATETDLLNKMGRQMGNNLNIDAAVLFIISPDLFYRVQKFSDYASTLNDYLRTYYG